MRNHFHATFSHITVSITVALLSGTACFHTPQLNAQAQRRLIDNERRACATLEANTVLSDTKRDTCADYELVRGQDARTVGLDAMALYRFQKALFYNPLFSDAHEAAGSVFLNRQDHERACAEFARALATDPDNLPAKRQRVQCLIALGSTEAAASLIAQCEGPEDIECYCAKGQRAIEGNRMSLPEGLTADSLMDACPQMPTVAVQQCESSLATGDCHGAVAACHNALTAWSGNRSARRVWRAAQMCVLHEAEMQASTESHASREVLETSFSL